MIAFRARQWGQSEWTLISVDNLGEEDGVEAEVAQIIGSALSTSVLHVQQLGEENEWGDLL